MKGGGIITVYADILFVVNFSMDFLTLFISGKLTNKKMKKLKLILGASIGSLSGTAITFVPYSSEITQGVFTVVFGFVVSLIMTYIAFGKYTSFFAMLRDCVIVWGSGALIGGVMTFVINMGEPVYFDYGRNFAVSFAVCAAVSLFTVRFILSGKSKKSAVVKITEGEETYTVKALCDSGSFISEPLTGVPVIIIRESELGNTGLRLKSDILTELRLRIIPINGICGNRILRGFIPDKVMIDDVEVRAIIASDGESSDYGGFDGIIPSILCK